MENLPHKEEPSDGDGQKGYTADFIAPLTIKEEIVDLYFEDLTKSPVKCTKQECIISVLFSDNNALQKALSVSSHKIDDGCCLTPLSRTITSLSPVASVGNPTDDGFKLSTEPQFGGLESATPKTTVVLTMNVDCGVHLAQYCLKDLNSCLHMAHCVISSTVVPGDLLLQYDASVSQLNVDQIMDRIYEYAKKFTTFVVAFPDHCNDKNLKQLLHSGSALVSCCLVGRFSGSQLYKICCQTTHAPVVQQLLSEANVVPFVGLIPTADACDKGRPKRQGIATSLSDATEADVKSVPSSSTIAESSTVLVPSDFPVPTRTEPNSNMTPGVETHDTGVTSAATAPITSQSNRVISNDFGSVDARGSSTSAIHSPAVEHEPQRSLAVPSSTASAANAFASSAAASDSQPAAVPSILSASADGNDQQTAVYTDSVRSANIPNAHVHVAEDNVTVTVSADSRTVEVFRKDLERHFRNDLEKLITTREPTCCVKLFYGDEGFLLYGNRGGVSKAQELLQVYFKRVSVKEQQLDARMLDDSNSLRRMRDVGSEILPVASKLNDAPARNKMADDFERSGLVTAPADGTTAGRMPNEQFKEELPSKIGEEAKLHVAATREQGFPDERSRYKFSGGGADRASVSNSLVLELDMGSVADQTADVLINSVDPGLMLSSGRISRSMLEKGGSGLQQELQQKYPNGIHEFKFAVTKGYKLNCKMVLHVACGPHQGRYSEEDFSAVIFDCLRYAENHGMKSIVFPAIGAGVLKYPPETVVKQLHSAINLFSTTVSQRNLRSVRCVVYDKPTYDAFKSALAKLLQDDRGAAKDLGLKPSPPSDTKQKKKMTHDSQVDEYTYRHSSESGSLRQPAGIATRHLMESDDQQSRMKTSQQYSVSSDHSAQQSAAYLSELGAWSEFLASWKFGPSYSDAAENRLYSQALSSDTRSLRRTPSSSSSRSTSERTHKKS